ncbi:hypothetical protein, partial [Turicimonas sp. TL08]
PSLYYYHYFTTYNQKKSREIFLLFSDSNYENKGVSVSNSGKRKRHLEAPIQNKRTINQGLMSETS